MSSNQHIDVSIADQTLRLMQGDALVQQWSISTATNGPGEQFGSECTPRGAHFIRAKIGEGMPEGAVFIGRRFTGEIYSRQLAEKFPDRDWILSRILWLCGKEVGRNRLGSVDSMQRFIYIHGTPDSEPMGVPKSHGCVRMRNKDIIDLYDRVEPGCAVLID